MFKKEELSYCVVEVHAGPSGGERVRQADWQLGASQSEQAQREQYRCGQTGGYWPGGDLPDDIMCPPNLENALTLC